MSSINSKLTLDFNLDNEIYYKLLKEEDFDFKNKDISVVVELTKDSKILIEISTNSILNLKIAESSIIKSLTVIEKTLKI